MQIPSNSEISDAVETEKPEVASSSEASMDSFYRLQAQLLKTTIAFSGVVFAATCFTYSLHIGLNYLLGACTGVVYLRMLSKNVEAIGRSSTRISSSRLALVAAMVLVASQWNQLEVMPVFLGFLTYKAALVGYIIWTVVPGEK
ncbi:ATP synthase subunit I [Halomicronema sp. CCY15110]|uniref:ATP synthase subunit I n=1 Tax=Halomicronema sp. CCY15110 TaxID=2767773 RepID=UPI0028157AA8|nr:ATP synthase subunit I [Halomicronema sp. CCY15110]